ncbi:type VI secretion system protein TssA [Hydrocarboniclastica marina]|uniref:Type VI secretion system protein TssA n=1 Tax=Hydrocarboniclastica marina TaxID=2259620 RepID=A0A4V1D8C7_9ALTE|nr:type VI secretion system protein TssA [Hydrocarboniclastica marina]MAL98853.1 type VI secretion system protein TssA [Alteromonadaceae bacterium]QCF24730.1 type VI secretion system protein TssA [Hydrocarboniclastica marina]
MNARVPFFFDADSLLADISAKHPCGDDTREDSSPSSPYFNLKDLRNQARALERQVLGDEDVLQVPQWRQLADAIPAVLTERSKDLEFVAWYIEALCREHGFAGLSQGFDLARTLIETRWDALYPQPDEEGLETRIAPLVGLNGVDAEGTLIQPILSITLFQSPALGDYATWHAEQASEVNRLEASKAQLRIKAGAASLEDLEQAVRETPIESLLAVSDAIDAALHSFATLSDVMDAAMAAPQPTTHIRQALERCKSVLVHHAGKRLDQARALVQSQAAAVQAGEGADQSRGDATGIPSGSDPIQIAIQSRNHALEQLRRLSDFFRQTEPHSPVSYAIGQAIRWSELPLPELMQELIADSGAREGFCRITGVPAPEGRE